ncbi:MAG: hypothetical protein MPW14_21580 [Candidatus Manganitrophus sp.]|nr:MAG: hypothetical protein MPW14_21580 [Candidatus Manganitrophus sp.]
MANAIEQLKTGLTVGYAGLGFRSGVTGSVRQQVHDGDTFQLRPIGNLGVRFLGVDAPEISFTPPESALYRPLRSALGAVPDRPLRSGPSPLSSGIAPRPRRLFEGENRTGSRAESPPACL